MKPNLPFLPLNTPMISSAFHPIQIRHQSVTNFPKSPITPFQDKKPLLLRSEIDKRFNSPVFPNTAPSNPMSQQSQKAEKETKSSPIMKFDLFSSKMNNKNLVDNKIEINQNFFQMDVTKRKPFIFGDINSILFNTSFEKKNKDTILGNKKGLFFTKTIENENKRSISLIKDDYEDIKNPEFNHNQRNNITNVINNNYYIQVNTKKPKQSDSLLQKKRGRKKMKIYSYTTSKSKKLKKKDKTKITLYLNQIKIQGISLKKFPLISVSKDFLSIEIFQRMLTEEHFFEYEPHHNLHNISYSQDKLNKAPFLSYFHNRMEMQTKLLPIEENRDIKDPYLLLKNYYSKIQRTVLQIQKNFIGKKKGSLNKELCIVLHKLIQSCNQIIDAILNFKPVALKKIKVVQKKNDYPTLNLTKFQKLCTYQCPFCLKCFEKGQGLGGHMSRHHPKQSEKYKEKMEIREKRTHKRYLLMEIKTQFFSLYKKNYKELLAKGAKEEIHSFLMEHRLEYLLYKKREQKKRNLGNCILFEEKCIPNEDPLSNSRNEMNNDTNMENNTQ